MPITAADPSAALVSAARPLDLLTPARTAGWQSANACTVPEIHAGDVILRLGSQRIPVRQLVNGPGAEERIERVADSLLPGYFPEQFIVLHGFSTEQTERVRRRLHRAGFRFLVGNLAEYVKWLKTRLGPLASVAYDSPVRALVEPLLCFIRKPQPVKPVPVRGDYSASGIAPSFKLGQLGVQAFETILSHQLGQQKFVNVEAEPSWQKRDVDLLVQLERLIRVEIKTEDYASSNLSLEDIGNVTKGTPGWLHFSECDVLVSIAWPAGEVWIQNFSRVKEWALSGKHRMFKAFGTASGQTYKSSFWLAPVDTLFDTFDDTVVLRIQDFLPVAYGDKFEHPSLVKKRYASRIVVPQYPD